VVAHAHSKFEQAKKLAHLSIRQAAEIVGVHHSTVLRWRKRTDPPRQAAPALTIDSLRLSRGNGRRCPRCGDHMWLMAVTGVCVECEIMQQVKLGNVAVRE
jgi:hypothetical protein